MKLTSSIWLLVLTLLVVPAPVQAALPVLPEIPVTLPDEVRQSLIVKRAPLAQRKLVLIDEGKAINQSCVKVEKGSSQHQDCLTKQAEFGAKVEILRSDMGKLALDIDAAIEADKQRRAVPNQDTSVVDARVPRDGAHLIAQVPELARSPAADRITKGFQALMNRDWPVVLAWWQDALQRDPSNGALQRSVVVAQWMVDQRKVAATGPVQPLTAAVLAASGGDYAEAIRQLERAKAENPTIAPHADRMITAIEQQAAQAVREATANWQIERQTRAVVEGLFETGLNRLSIGDEKGAEEAFRNADFFSMGLPPSQLPYIPPPTGSGKAPSAQPSKRDVIGK